MTNQWQVTAIAALFCVVAAPALALSNRTNVASTGVDSGTCGVTAPCRTFQYAHDQTAAKGQIVVLDTAGYGTVVITKAISIINESNSAIINVPSGTGITINAGASDAVTLRGLTIEGLGTGENGIAFNSGGGLTVDRCAIQNFSASLGTDISGAGIVIRPTSGSMTFEIVNTVTSNNGGYGVSYRPASGNTAARGVIDRIVTTHNNRGISVDLTASSGSAAVNIVNAVSSNNLGSSLGFYASPGSVKAVVDLSTISGNGFAGVAAEGTARVFLSRSVVTGSTYGVLNSTSPNTFFTFGDNRITSNTNDVGGPALDTTIGVK